jgi:hypothetical protein
MFEYLLKECYADKNYKTKKDTIILIVVSLLAIALAIFLILSIMNKTEDESTWGYDIAFYIIALVESIFIPIVSRNTENSRKSEFDLLKNKIKCINAHINTINEDFKKQEGLPIISVKALICEGEDIIKYENPLFSKTGVFSLLVIPTILVLITSFINQIKLEYLLYIIVFVILLILAFYIAYLINIIFIPLNNKYEKIKFLRLLKLINDSEISQPKIDKHKKESDARCD